MKDYFACSKDDVSSNKTLKEARNYILLQIKQLIQFIFVKTLTDHFSVRASETYIFKIPFTPLSALMWFNEQSLHIRIS